MIRFTQDGQEYWFDPEDAETNYDGDDLSVAKTLENIESMASDVSVPSDEVDEIMTGPTNLKYSSEKAEEIVTSLLKTRDTVSFTQKSSSPQVIDRNRVRTVDGDIEKSPHIDSVRIVDNETVLLKKIPDEASHIPPGEDPPPGSVTFEGERGGTYAISPEDLAETMDGVSAEDIEEEADVVDFDSEAASDKIPPEEREIPDGVSGPIDTWDPDNVDEIVSPNMRYAEIGSDAHPLFYRRPEPDEIDEYVEAVQNEEEWQKGKDEFEKGFLEDDDTKNEYTDEDGNWDEDRLEKHDEWTDELLNPEATVPQGEEATAMLVLGPPGAGKGYWQEQVEDGEYGDDLGGKEFTHVNSDETKEPIPEYEGSNASTVHDEASKMAKEDLATKTVENNQNMILDKVATTPDSTRNLISMVEDAGYDIRASFVEVPDDKAAHNAVSRYYQEGRFTPFEYLLSGGPDGESAGEASRETFETIVDEFDIPDEKIGQFNNDVEWGNIPEAEEIGDELLKMFLRWIGGDVAQKYAKETR